MWQFAKIVSKKVLNGLGVDVIKSNTLQKLIKKYEEHERLTSDIEFFLTSLIRVLL